MVTSAQLHTLLAQRPSVGVTDVRNRPLRDLRLSVTDRCNLRCAYCMPEEEYDWLARDSFPDLQGAGDPGRGVFRRDPHREMHTRGG
jgi:hypothetical protein